MRNLFVFSVLLLLFGRGTSNFDILNELLKNEELPSSAFQKESVQIIPTVIHVSSTPSSSFSRKLFKKPVFDKEASQSSNFEMTVSKQVGENGKMKTEFEQTKQVTFPDGEVIRETRSKPFDSPVVSVKRKIIRRKAKTSPNPYGSFLQFLMKPKAEEPSINQSFPPIFADLDENRSLMSNPLRPRQVHRRVKIRKGFKRIVRHHRKGNKVKKSIVTHRFKTRTVEKRFAKRKPSFFKTRPIKRKRITIFKRKRKVIRSKNSGPVDFNELISNLLRPDPKPVRLVKISKVYPKFSGHPLLNSFYKLRRRSNLRTPLVFPPLGHKRLKSFSLNLLPRPVSRPKLIAVGISIKPHRRNIGLGLANLLKELGPVLNPI